MAGTVTQENVPIGRAGVRKHTFNVIGDASGGAVTDAPSQRDITGWILKVCTDPGSPAPTDLYDLALEDAGGMDVMGGALADRATAAKEQALPVIDTVSVAVFNEGPLTLTVANQSVNSAIITVDIYYLTE